MSVFPFLGKLEEKELKEFLKNMDAETAMKLSKAMDAAGTKGGNLAALKKHWKAPRYVMFFHGACVTAYVEKNVQNL